jgi:predicted nucleic acid-binding protein
MIVIADTAPVNYLILIEAIELLPKLYGQIVIPESVLSELNAGRTPAPVKLWVRNKPDWLRVEKAALESLKETAAFLDAGEREAIALARTLHADLLILDERAGRREAKRLNLPVTGTLGVLRTASERGLIQIDAAIERLRKTSFTSRQPSSKIFSGAESLSVRLPVLG